MIVIGLLLRISSTAVSASAASVAASVDIRGHQSRIDAVVMVAVEVALARGRAAITAVSVYRVSLRD